jgi:hypothetical protein
MKLLEPVEYHLHLNTGEHIEVLELDEERIDALKIPEIKETLANLLSLCNPVTRLAVEEAKKGYSDKLENQLRTSPVAALIKIDKPKCIEFKGCPVEKKNDCITTKVAGKKKKSIPVCWEYSIGDIGGFNRVLAADLARHIVHAWNQDMYVLTISG